MTATSHPQGASFGNAINYIYEGRLDEHKDKKEALIMHSDNIRVPRGADDLKGRNRMKADFISQAEVHKQYGNENRKNYVGHHSLNFSASDMVDLSPKKIEQITGDYIKDAGINQTQYIAVAHQDTDLYHVHIIFNRATNKHTLYNDWREHNKTAERAVALNLKYGLENVKKQVALANSPDVLAIRSAHEDIQKLKTDELISRAKNLHHLSKICEAEKRSFKEQGDIIKIEDKEYKKTDLQVLFYDNRGEDRANARQRHIEENNKRKEDKKNKSKNHEIKKNKREGRKTEPELTEDELAEQQLKDVKEKIAKSAKLGDMVEDKLKEAKSEKQFFEELGKEGFTVIETNNKQNYIFSKDEIKTERPKYWIEKQFTQHTSTPIMERKVEPTNLTKAPEESTSLGIGEMAGQKASGGVKKLDSEPEEEIKRRKKIKYKL